MLITVTGGSGSGKSEYAEALAVKLAGDCESAPAGRDLSSREGGSSSLVYLATMPVLGEEGRQRVRRHRALRSGKGFLTIERTKDLSSIPGELLRGNTVLLEDLSNLIAGEMFQEGKIFPEEEVCLRVRAGLEYVAGQTENLVIVMNEVYSDGRHFDAGTESFIRTAGTLSREWAKRADEACELVYGIPVFLKKKEDPADII